MRDIRVRNASVTAKFHDPITGVTSNLDVEIRSTYDSARGFDVIIGDEQVLSLAFRNGKWYADKGPPISDKKRTRPFPTLPKNLERDATMQKAHDAEIRKIEKESNQ